MAIFVTGDVHGGAEYGSSRFSSKSWPDGRTLSRDDVVVVAGDFGFVWDGSNTDRYWLDWFESKPWTTCFVDGNHENPPGCWRNSPKPSGTAGASTSHARMCCT